VLILVEPGLADVELSRAEAFLAAAIGEWEDIPITRVAAPALVSCEPSSEDGLVFFNPPREGVAEDIAALIARAKDRGAVILPIALTAAGRRPPEAASTRQSFDVIDQLRRRELDESQLGVIGAAFAREALSMLMPTYVQSRLRLFLCHRRVDGEEAVSHLDRALSVRHEHVFRDLIEIQVGQEAQGKIDDALAGADVLVFLDSPGAGESWWIQHELATALGRAIPIVWVRVGRAGERAALAVEPGDTPHIEQADVTRDGAGVLADEILRTATRLSRAHARTSQRALQRLRQWARTHDARIEVLDARQRIFQVRYPPPPQVRPYPLRAATDVVQFFGRGLQEQDQRALESFLTELGMGPHDKECRAFDAAIMLDPTASGQRAMGEWSVAEHPSGYLSTLAAPAATTSGERTRLLLLGAFPAGDLAREQVAPAVHAVADTWLRLGGAIVCGGHPTFVPLLTEAARAVLGERSRDSLTVYWSEFFAAPAQIAELAPQAQVVPVAASETRDDSLTAMRRRMIDEGGVSAVIAIGGRTTEGGSHQPGIEEEIRLARMAGLPVYVLGAPGGQAALIATREATSGRPWSGLGNALDANSNALLRETDAYEDAARLIWDTL
jgi:hypothetical protein